MGLFSKVGEYIFFLRGTFGKPESWRMYWKEFMRQMYQVGVESIPIVIVVALFIGAVTAIQFAYQLGTFFVPTYYIGYIVRDTMILEMAPTMSCMVLAGKVGSNMASELGNMRITEQIDALEIMGLNTSPYLVGTKIWAAFFIIPALVILAALIGIIGGLLAMLAGEISTIADYERGLRSFFSPLNFQLMLAKGFVFGFILSSVSCFYGYNVRGGAIDIGKASTTAVVNSNILILIFDLIIARLFL
ncbi:MAG: MlaE family ABC transporter permease [Chitinophagales bacterium]